ncbi:MAG: tetratricopeptide repeat protein [bacterium]
MKKSFVISIVLVMFLGSSSGCALNRYTGPAKDMDIYVQKISADDALHEYRDTIAKYRGELSSDILAKRRVEIYRALGEICHEHELYHEAIVFYEAALGLDPRHIEVRFLLGMIYFKMAILSRAGEEFDVLIKMQEGTWRSYYWRGRVYQETGLYDEAVGMYLKGVRRNPDNADIHYSLGLVYQAQGKLDDAREAFNHALGRKENEADYLISLGYNYFLEAQYEKARSAYSRALALDADNPNAHIKVGLTYYRQGEWDKAKNEFGRAIKTKPSESIAYFLRALCSYRQGDKDDFMRDIQKARALGSPGIVAELAVRAMDLRGQDLRSSVIDQKENKDGGK